MSSHLVWSIIRNNNAFLLKKRNISKPFSTEPNNLTNLSSYRYNGLVHKKTVGIVDGPDKKGFTLVYKRPKKQNKPKECTMKTTFKSGPRRSLFKLKRLMKNEKYRTDLTKVALRRASAVLRSQKPKRGKQPKKAQE
ncbi:60S ribosomal protein L28-like [Coccinella septempunctata]|uniref:60S ribosomal protein L28-like n=1 Tax=Coccinella septempunctata TaxID=41139 RepID=UPI001D098D8F|nr:60S ribosomal protein L28-like [Coccinella septempunctata]XP_044766927.1 60S ribosomal protein L28-like [Coccinella septempunctata]